MPRIKADDVGPSPVDLHVGAKVKARRLLQGLSQEDLANSIGLTFQQVQKYERGTNRISVSRLVDIAKVLKAPVDYFIDGSQALAQKVSQNKGFADNKQLALDDEPMMKRDILDLVRAYSQIKNPQLKKQILEMTKAMSSSDTKK